MKKILLAGVAALFLATGTAHAGERTLPDGRVVLPMKIPPGFAQSSPPPGYPRFCICQGEETDGSRFMYPTYCVLDISKIPSTCIVPLESRTQKYTMLCGDIEAIVTVTRKYDDLGPSNKFDVYVADPKIITQKEAKDGHLYLNGKQCIPTKVWVCPNKTQEGVC
jgi:hypothetical protein